MIGGFPCTCNNCGQVLISIEHDDTHHPTLDNVIDHFTHVKPDGSEQTVEICPKCDEELTGQSTTLID